MNLFRRLALSTYYYGTYPYRRAALQRQAAQGNAPISVLFYHRVADTHPNGWTMTRKSFARQMEWLQNNTELISLAEVQQRMLPGNSPRPAVSVTFDDGYAENCEFALPLLIEAKIPVTYLVSLDFVTSGRSFPHDKERGQHLAPNTIDQLREMVDAGIEIGAHTDTHPSMGSIKDPDEMRREMVEATLELGDLVGQPIRYFAYPFGQSENLDADAARMAAEEAGIQAVCSAFGAYNLPGNDPFHIRRIHGDPEFTRWRNWVSVDPRKVNEGQDVGNELEMSDSLSYWVKPSVSGKSVSSTSSSNTKTRQSTGVNQ